MVLVKGACLGGHHAGVANIFIGGRITYPPFFVNNWDSVKAFNGK